MEGQTKTSIDYFHIILFSGFLFGFFLPLNTKLGNISLILFLIGVSFLVFKKKMKFNNENVRILKYSTLVLILPLFVSLFYHHELLKVLDVLGRRITYFLVPLALLFFSSKQIIHLKNYSLRGILYGSILSSTILLFNNFLNYYATRPSFSIDSELLGFYYTGFDFTKLFDIHPSYFGMYVLLSVIVLLFGNLAIPKTLRIFILFFFFLTILFLGARIILFFYFLIVLVYVSRFVLMFYGKTKKAIFSFLAVVFIVSGLIYLLIKETYIYTTLTKEVVWELSFNVNNKYNSKTLGDSRVARWNVAIDLIHDQTIFGYGIGNEKDVLETGFRRAKMDISAANRYDAHNLFLGYGLEAGIVGLLLLFYYFFNSLFLFFRYRKAMYFLFFLSVVGICFVENYLNNNAAVTFVGFYGNLFLFQTLIKSNDEDGLS